MERKLVHANVPIMNWSMANAVADTATIRAITSEEFAKPNGLLHLTPERNSNECREGPFRRD